MFRILGFAPSNPTTTACSNIRVLMIDIHLVTDMVVCMFLYAALYVQRAYFYAHYV